ncbi:hypothetical protein [Undibacterium sp. TJN19]|uniref:hypothetical protein n=1 Tax=Undibacterium sp. TJN19 TaxID=3413055 RepID=UPI003BF10C11
MSVEIVQRPDGALGLVGDSTGGNGGFLPVTATYTATSPAAMSLFSANRNYIVQDITGRVDVSGTGGACTISLYNVPTGAAIASGTLLHTGTYNVAGTVNTKQVLTLSATASALVISAGSAIGLVVTGTPTSAVGSVTVTLSPAN